MSLHDISVHICRMPLTNHYYYLLFVSMILLYIVVVVYCIVVGGVVVHEMYTGIYEVAQTENSIIYGIIDNKQYPQ